MPNSTVKRRIKSSRRNGKTGIKALSKNGHVKSKASKGGSSNGRLRSKAAIAVVKNENLDKSVKTIPNNDHSEMFLLLRKEITHDFITMTFAIGVTGLILSAILLGVGTQTMTVRSKIILALFSAALFSVPIWAKSVVSLLNDAREALRNLTRISLEYFNGWYDKQLTRVFNRDRLIIFALAGIAAGLVFLPQLQPNDDADTSGILRLILGGLILAVCGIALHVEHQLIFFYRSIPELDIMFFGNQDPTSDVRRMTNVSFRLVAWWSWFAVLAQITAFMTPWFNNSWIPVLVLFGAAPGLLLIIAQFKVHAAMVDEKRRLVNDFSKQIKPSLDMVQNRPTLANVFRFRVLSEVQQQMEKMPEWTFDVKSVLTILSSALFPIVLVVAQSWLRYYGILNP